MPLSPKHILWKENDKMGKKVQIGLYVLTMVATVVILDLLFFRYRSGERLIANIGIVVVYVVFYLALLRNRRSWCE